MYQLQTLPSPVPYNEDLWKDSQQALQHLPKSMSLCQGMQNLMLPTLLSYSWRNIERKTKKSTCSSWIGGPSSTWTDLEWPSITPGPWGLSLRVSTPLPGYYQRCPVGISSVFSISIRGHQGSALSLLLFILCMDTAMADTLMDALVRWQCSTRQQC